MNDLFSIAKNRMYKNKLMESKQIRHKIILGLQEILYTRSHETGDHIERLKRLSLAFAKSLGYALESVEMRI